MRLHLGMLQAIQAGDVEEADRCEQKLQVCGWVAAASWDLVCTAATAGHPPERQRLSNALDAATPPAVPGNMPGDCNCMHAHVSLRCVRCARHATQAAIMQHEEEERRQHRTHHERGSGGGGWTDGPSYRQFY